MTAAASPPLSAVARAVGLLAQSRDLPAQLAGDAFDQVMRGEATPVQIAALLVGLRTKRETAEEVAAVAGALRRAMVTVPAGSSDHLIDTCGTGGGTVTTFNISTAAAFVAAGAGANVAKHGNRSFTSRCGSADVLEALGVAIQLSPEAAALVLREARITFLFAPSFHPAMRHVGPVRKELGVQTVMNLVGPLANPAGVRRQVLGVADAERAPLMAEALHRLGAEHALVVHARVGMDEISPQGLTDVWEVTPDGVRTWVLDPADLGLAAEGVEGLAGGEPAANGRRIAALLTRERKDVRDEAAVLLNAGAALYVAGLARDLGQGVARARAALEEGKGAGRLEAMRQATAAAGAPN
jgi:anthranilate phosphoribosyltransferase